MGELPVLTIEIALVMSLLAFTVLLFASDLLRVDVAAVLVMTLLGLLIFVPGLEELVSKDLLFSGFASNAVVSIIAVMIIGGGLDKTGVMEFVAGLILRIGGRTEHRIVALISSVVALISSFMQNVGATALFLPVVARISGRTGLPLSHLLMPMGFCAILGGTITMVGSSPLIMLNDLIENANRSLPEAMQMQKLGLFAVAPVGLALVATGLAYFLLLGDRLLPKVSIESGARGAGTVEYLRRVYGLHTAIREVVVPTVSPLVNRDILDVQRDFEVRIVASNYANKVLVCPPVEAPILAPAVLGIIAQPEDFQRFVDENHLRVRKDLRAFRRTLSRRIAGIAELVIPPDSQLIGKTVRELRLRRTYGLSLLSIFRGGENIAAQLQDVPFQAGDTLVCHTRWDNLAELERSRDFIVVTSDYPREQARSHKISVALGFFALALGLVLFTDILLPVALLVGAVGMIIGGVLTMDEAYRAVSWKTVFLLAGLLPLGHAVESSGTANYVAQHLLHWLGETQPWVLQTLVAVLATIFTLVMSNVGATILLVPIAVNLATGGGGDPTMFALTVAVATSNAFLIPTHQVNALIMGPGGYRVADFFRAGGPMTLLFLVVSLLMLNLVF